MLLSSHSLLYSLFSTTDKINPDGKTSLFHVKEISYKITIIPCAAKNVCWITSSSCLRVSSRHQSSSLKKDLLDDVSTKEEKLISRQRRRRQKRRFFNWVSQEGFDYTWHRNQTWRISLSVHYLSVHADNMIQMKSLTHHLRQVSLVLYISQERKKNEIGDPETD